MVKKSLDKAKRETGNIQLLHGNFTNGFRESDVYRQPLDDLGCTPVLDPGDAACFQERRVAQDAQLWDRPHHRTSITI